MATIQFFEGINPQDVPTSSVTELLAVDNVTAILAQYAADWSEAANQNGLLLSDVSRPMPELLADVCALLGLDAAAVLGAELAARLATWADAPLAVEVAA